MRYHASLASIGFGTPVRGISTHHKVEGQFDAYGLSGRCHPFSAEADLDPLFAGLAEDLADAGPVRAQFAQVKAKERAVLSGYHGKIARWLADHSEAGA